MREFRIESDERGKRREARNRLLSWCTVLLLLGALISLFVLRSLGVKADSSLRSLMVLTLVAAIAAIYILAFREGMRRARRGMSFVLDDHGITRRKRGWPDVTIAYTELSELRDEPTRLVVESVEPPRTIAVPHDILDYKVIRTELEKHHPLVPARTNLPLEAIFVLIISVSSWALFLWVQDAMVVVSAGVVALITLAFGSRRLWTLFHHGPKRWVMQVCLGFAWCVAIVLIVVRAIKL